MFAKPTRRLGLALACALALMTSACVVSPLVVSDGPGGLGGPGAKPAIPGINPVINALTANPTSTADRDAKITFMVNVSANGPVQYNWSATTGTLSSTTGQLVTWTPGADAKPGTAQISVIVTTANGGSQTGTVTVQILADGGAKVVSAPGSPAPSAAPSASPSPAASASPAASTSPSASPSPAASDDVAADDDATGVADDDEATDADDTDADADATDDEVDGDADATDADDEATDAA